jgi:hypothetical protein
MFHERLVSAGMPCIGFVVNKVHPSRPASITVPQIEAALAAEPSVASLGLSGTTRTMTAQALVAAHGEIQTLAAADHDQIARLRAAGGPAETLVEVPLQHGDVHDVDRLVALERHLLA